LKTGADCVKCTIKIMKTINVGLKTKAQLKAFEDMFLETFWHFLIPPGGCDITGTSFYNSTE